ncbi:MAG: hypothetical protein RBR15_06930, partial [Sphaerochaeta sp.]|nr:hypothetical protein [Sphaerochaeta sp.]
TKGKRVQEYGQFHGNDLFRLWGVGDSKSYHHVALPTRFSEKPENISYNFIQDKITQLAIFNTQNKKFVLPNKYVVIISPIPFFLFIELGQSFYNKHIKYSLQQLDCKHACIARGEIPHLLSL